MQGHVVSSLGHFHEGEGRGFFAGQLPYIRDSRVVRLGDHGPDGGSTLVAVKGNHLPLGVGGGSRVQLNVDVLVAADGSGEFGSHEGEVLLRRPIEVVDRGGSASVTDLEGERFHPVTVRAGANIDGVDDFAILDSEDLFASASTTGNTREGDVVDVVAVLTTVDATVLAVVPTEGVRASRHVVGALRPTVGRGTAFVELLHAVDVEAAIVPAGALRGDAAVERNGSVFDILNGSFNVRLGATDVVVAAGHAVGASMRVAAPNDPRIG